jgi:hypothetical protein
MGGIDLKMQLGTFVHVIRCWEQDACSMQWHEAGSLSRRDMARVHYAALGTCAQT